MQIGQTCNYLILKGKVASRFVICGGFLRKTRGGSHGAIGAPYAAAQEPRETNLKDLAGRVIFRKVALPARSLNVFSLRVRAARQQTANPEKVCRISSPEYA
jgi:hypothetical protein